MKLVYQLGPVTFHIMEKNNKFYAMVWDDETMEDLYTSVACDSKQTAQQLLAKFLLNTLDESEKSSQENI